MRYATLGSDPRSQRRVSVLALGGMRFGTTTDERTSHAILDRYVEAGGTFIDTSNNYAFWADGSRGGHSEAVLGRWRTSRGITDEVVIATKLGARPTEAGVEFARRPEYDEGLSPAAIAAAARESRERLGMDRIDLLYAHVEDPHTPIETTAEVLAALVAEGTAGLLGLSNHRAWRVARARTHARARGIPAVEVLQYHRSYVRHAPDVPSRRSRFGDPGVPTPDLLDHMAADPGLTLVAYSPLLGGGYTRADRAPGPDYGGEANAARLNVLRDVTHETGATPNQVVLAWLIGDRLPTIPLVGASSVAQLDESLEAVELELTADQRARLDDAR